MFDEDIVRENGKISKESESLASVRTPHGVVDDDNNPNEHIEKQDSNEKLKAEEKITELTLKNSIISESNIRLQKEKEEISAVVDSIKNKLTEFSLNLPTHTAEEGSSGRTGEDGLTLNSVQYVALTRLTIENSVISESNKRLLKEKDEQTAFVDSIKNKLKKFSTNLPIPTAEEGSSGGAGDDGVITQLTNMINQHEDLKRNVRILEEENSLQKTKIKSLKATGRQLIKRSMAEVNFRKAEVIFIKSIKNKLKEFSSNLPIPTAEEGSSGGAGYDGVITQLTNLINQNQNLKQNVRDSTQLVQGFEKDKLKYSNEIAKLNDELAATKKKIDEVNHKYKELNFKNKNEELRSRLLGNRLTSTTEKNISLGKTKEMLESRRDSLKLVLVTTKKNVEKLNEDETIENLTKEGESLQNLKGNSCEDILAEIDKGLTEHRTSCNLQKQKLRNAENELWCLRESNNMLKNEISRIEEENEENEDEYEDEYDPTIENLERSNSDLINQLNNFANLCAQKDAEIKDLRTRLKNFKRRKYFRRFQPHWTN
ncbi:uncharacterized protein LOC111702018 [Eurytemora carolleeae]|uniref:uncharacterized protein LOC111702018 n=1 Tax=Eurytemora carolleeae TaxID=1294199 RepID=UPI000C77469C|nr:uncharacterized protein LOC111702018 [Eurytemora carolleeae]|eukprot:XP_023329305.1 uncharacterized protein LOC111702018 [Eurytemora affinis]